MPVNRIVEFKSGPTKERSINLCSDLMCLQKAMKRSVPFWIYAYSIIKLWKKFLTMYLSSKNTSIVTKQKHFRKMVNFKVFWGGTPEGVDRFWWNKKKGTTRPQIGYCVKIWRSYVKRSSCYARNIHTNKDTHKVNNRTNLFQQSWFLHWSLNYCWRFPIMDLQTSKQCYFVWKDEN